MLVTFTWAVLAVYVCRGWVPGTAHWVKGVHMGGTVHGTDKDTQIVMEENVRCICILVLCVHAAHVMPVKLCTLLVNGACDLALPAWA